MIFKCIFYDFDGVMTDNKVILSESGEESVIVNRSDGLAISYFKKMNIKQYIISTEENEVVSKRAKKLGIDVHQGINNKLSKIKSLMNENDYENRDVAYVGNDLNDLEVMKFLSNTFCPNDSHKEILQVSSVILDSSGGNGVIMALYNYMELGNV
tara:strand:- start:61 stop:525 length:465 start_codon:yes stop_codon:yes gene_type:complete